MVQNRQPFYTDDDWSKQISHLFLDQWYQKRTAGRYLRLDDDSRLSFWLQRKCGVDVIAWLTPEQQYTLVEEKIRRTKYNDFFLETESCSVEGRKKKGWIKTGKADWLLYCFYRDDTARLECHLLDFLPLKHWFNGRMAAEGPSLNWRRIETTQKNHTVGYAVPSQDIPAEMKLDTFTLSARTK